MKAFFGCFTSSKAYRVFNKCLLNVKESMLVSFNETNPHISKIIKDADISSSEDSCRIDPTISIFSPTNRNSNPTSSEETPDEQKSETLDYFRSSNTCYSELPKS